MTFTKSAIEIFQKVIDVYHVLDDIDQALHNPFEAGIESTLYHKCWIDTVQWHLEDVIRDPQISPDRALEIKRRIDASNQDRTDMVERIDDYFLAEVASNTTSTGGRINTETPAWAIDRLSILCLKIYHMRLETERTDVGADHLDKCKQKLATLLEQLSDLSQAIDQLIDEIKEGRVQMKLYRQMKMYNDPSLNPVLYQSND